MSRLRPYSQIGLCALLGGLLVQQAGAVNGATNVPAFPAQDVLRNLPLHFEPNQGQWSPQVRFSAKAGGYRFVLTGKEALFGFPGPEGRPAQTLGMSFLHANTASRITGVDRLPTFSNYFLGNRKDDWRRRVPHYAKVRYENLYPGVDVVYYGNGNLLEYDLVLRPGADPKQIRLQYRGADRLSITPDGDLTLNLPTGVLVQKRPVIYQQEAGSSARREIQGRYRLISRNVVGVELDAYDRTRPVTIDPTLTYGTLIGGPGQDVIVGVRADQNGMIYIAGYTVACNITATADAFQTTEGSLYDVFVAMIDPTQAGAAGLAYFTYLGGDGDDKAAAMTIDSTGFVYVVGSTYSSDFPMGGSSAQPKNGGGNSDGFVAMLQLHSTDGGDLVYSSYLGGSDVDVATGVDVDAAGNIYVIGTTISGDFPLTSNAFQGARWGARDAFIVELTPTASTTLTYSSFFGGDGSDWGRAIAVTSSGIVYIAGATLSDQFPITGDAIQPTRNAGQDMFVAMMDLTKAGSDGLLYSTFLGGSDVDDAYALAVDPKGKLLLAGYSTSFDFPVTANAYQPRNHGYNDIIVMRLDLGQSGAAGLLYSTYFGGSLGEVAYGIASDAAGDIFITGYTGSPDFPVTPDAYQPAYGNGIEAFLSKLDPTQSGAASLVYSTYIGTEGVHTGESVSVGPDGKIYVAGLTGPNYIQPTWNCMQGWYGGGISDGFVFVMTP